ncbi:hypothetical protein J4Q44_G00143630 [Coregonus suidteri]|uniref:Uncharacterized protein n=1 Tax=Coregonus suidteri TaxID=861788 RepID=A0AAN8LR30_9TELE
MYTTQYPPFRRFQVDNSVVQQYYEKITRKPSDNMTLIAILASCGALLAMIVGFAIYASYHRKSYRKNHQQHLTEELQTVESPVTMTTPRWR